MNESSKVAAEFWIDHEQLQTIQRGSKLEQKVTELFQLLRGPVYRYLVGILRSHEEAEELTQEVFLSLFRCLHKGEAVGNCRAWVFRVAHNLAINIQKKRELFGPFDPTLRVPMSEQSPDPRPGPEQRVLDQEKHDRLQAALARLSQQEWLCLDLRAEGLRFREIAEVLGIRISTVETFIDRGMKKIMREIHD